MRTPRIIITSAISNSILDEQDGLQRRSTARAVRDSTQPDDRKLRRAIRTVLVGDAPRGMIVAARRCDPRYRIGMLVKPVRSPELADGRRRPAVAVFMRVPHAAWHASRGELYASCSISSAPAQACSPWP